MFVSDNIKGTSIRGNVNTNYADCDDGINNDNGDNNDRNNNLGDNSDVVISNSSYDS
uniref:Dentin sialophosphopreproprotein n=1 Tax=Loa loa TaxID=7209 RepID=A0A1I7VVQ2_LOALO